MFLHSLKAAEPRCGVLGSNLMLRSSPWRLGTGERCTFIALYFNFKPQIINTCLINDGYAEYIVRRTRSLGTVVALRGNRGQTTATQAKHAQASKPPSPSLRIGTPRPVAYTCVGIRIEQQIVVVTIPLTEVAFARVHRRPTGLCALATIRKVLFLASNANIVETQPASIGLGMAVAWHMAAANLDRNLRRRKRSAAACLGG